MSIDLSAVPWRVTTDNTEPCIVIDIRVAITRAHLVAACMWNIYKGAPINRTAITRTLIEVIETHGTTGLKSIIAGSVDCAGPSRHNAEIYVDAAFPNFKNIDTGPLR